MDNWKGESQLIRGEIEGGYNLAIGEPEVVGDAFCHTYPRHFPADVTYPSTKPLPALEEQIRRWLELSPNQHVVVTVGAKQALHAIAAFWRSYGITVVDYPVPYWPSIPSILKTHGIERQHMANCKLETYPGNPITTYKPDFSGWNDVWDAAYAHPTYGVPRKEQSEMVREAPISVWSAGKMLGCPGVRVGWVITSRPEVAQFVAKFVEQQTSGVPTSSQYFVAGAMATAFPTRDSIEAEANAKIKQNIISLELTRTLKSCVGVPSSSVFDYPVLYSMPELGMFAVLAVSNSNLQIMKKNKVAFLEGEAFGFPNFPNSRYVRINLGLRNDKFKKAITQLFEGVKHD